MIESSFPAIMALLAVLLTLSAFFSGSETALFSLTRARVRQFRDAGGFIGRRVAELVRLPRRLLITILLGNLLVNTATSSILADLSNCVCGPGAVCIAVVVTTVLLLVFGEITPKILAMLRPVHAARLVAVPLSFFVVVLTPARVVLRLTTNFLLQVLRQGHVVSEPLLTREEFRATVRTGKTQGGLDADEAELIHAIASFRTAVASEVMVPRPEMICVPETATLADAARTARRSRRARLPVYRGTVDHVTGVLIVAHIPAWLERVTLGTPLAGLPAAGEMPPLIVPPFLVPEMRHIDALLADMHDRNEQMAILLDEYGGTAGMVTRASILDALLGGMIGYGERRAVLRIQQDGDVVASGSTRLAHINWDCNFNLPEDQDDTIAGYVMRLLGAMPRPGQRITDEQCEYTVLQMTGTRLDFIRIHPTRGAR